MISAQEAKLIYDNSGVEVQEFLDQKIEHAVKIAAGLGKRYYIYHLGSIAPYMRIHQEDHRVEMLAAEELKKLGYHVSIGTYGDSYVPRGLSDDEGNGPDHKNYGITIGW